MEFDLPKGTTSIIKVIGVGGGGSNAVNHMFDQEIKGVDFIVCNTDRQALDISPVPYKIQLGPSLTEGRGAGAIPEIGRNAAVENIEDIRALLSGGTKMVFVTAGMGGGTGTGAAPVIAQVAKELNILTVGIVTVPFAFEGRRRRQQAEEGLDVMRQCVDTLLVINNERLREVGGNMSLAQAFAMADNVLATAAKGIADVITTTGAINVDFNDVNTVMRDSGVAIMGSAVSEGEGRAINAVQEALTSPLLNDNNIEGAKYILLNITYGDIEVTMDEIGEITDYIQDEAGSTADVIWGHGYDPTLGNKLSVTLVATGFNSTPFTGFEKAPEKTVSVLEDEPKNEIKTPLTSPTHQVIPEKKEEEPFLKSDPRVEEVKSTNSGTIEFDWEVKSEAKPMVTPMSTPSVEEKEEPKRYFLEDEAEAKVELENVVQKAPVSAEELQRRNMERMERIKNYNSKLKKAEGLKELEDEPAFVRRNIHLDQVVKSEELNVSRFGLSDDGIKTNNSFLHDNVD
ncbi:MAG: cell division protein FtsZ [Fluviicola sp.]|jgi:cell division protein FtsZ|uniref:cell division protein FtsZ n=1 Tax=Fluviicola sp. TaxID=1917219 RepID=UPI0026274C52|nr:cell division protein FtsZ [Fluviicola sp.]MDF3028598.1 cell division protein FtsZ [Fluviicola sp.]